MLLFITFATTICVASQALPETSFSSDEFAKYFGSEEFSADLKLSNNVAEFTVSNVLRHNRILLTDGTSTTIVRQIFTNIREVLTNENGAKDIQRLIGALAAVLLDENGSKFVQMVCKFAQTMGKDQKSVNKILRNIILTLMPVLLHENAAIGIEGLVEGMKVYFSELTPERVDAAIRKLQTSS